MQLDTGCADTLNTPCSSVEGPSPAVGPPSHPSTQLLVPDAFRSKVGDHVAHAECPLSQTGSLGYCRNTSHFTCGTPTPTSFEREDYPVPVRQPYVGAESTYLVVCTM